MVSEYRNKISEEKIDEYFAGLDDGSITPEEFKTEEPEYEPEEESEAEPTETPASLFNAEGL